MTYLEGYLAIGVVFLVWGWYRGWRTPQQGGEEYDWEVRVLGNILFVVMWPVFMLRVLAKWDKNNIKENT